MKRAVFGLLVFLHIAAVAFAQNTVTLDNAAQDCARYLQGRFPKGTRAALVAVSSENQELGEYVLKKLGAVLVNGGWFTVVERNAAALASIEQEMERHLNFFVSEETELSIGKQLGAEIIISGSFSRSAQNWRLDVQATRVESTQRVGQWAAEIRSDPAWASLAPLHSAAEEPIPEGLLYEIVNISTVTITKYVGSAVTINIPSHIEGKPVTSIGERAFDSCYRLSSINIPSSVTSIGDGAFAWCNNLTNVTIPSSVSSIGDSAFFYCLSLTSITIPSSVTSIGDGAFRTCRSLISIIIPSSVSFIGATAFGACSNLTSITVDNRNSTYASMDGVLFDKNIRTIIQYPAGKTARTYSIPSSVTSIGKTAFYYCSNLTSITIPSSVTSTGDYAFFGCSSLTRINIPSSVTSIDDGTFSDCSSLTSINIPYTVTSIGDSAFSGCSSLTSITIPSSVTSISRYAFSRCSSLTSINIPYTVTSIGDWAFSNCSSLTSITIPSSVTSIGQWAFSGCSSLTNITIPSSVTSISSYVFTGCSSLISVTVDNRNPTYASMDGVLFNKNMRTIIAYPAGKTERTYTIPSSVTSIGSRAFSYCTNLTNINIPSSVIFIRSLAFDNCSSLTSVTIPSSVTSIGDWAFQVCTSLTSVSIPSSVTSIERYAFTACDNLTSVTLSRRTQVGEHAFPSSVRITYRD